MESNPFENEKIATEWISAIENDRAGASRTNDIYPFISKWMEELKPGRVLDIGCGQGDTSSLIKEPVKYIGVDPSKFLINRAKELHSRSNTEFVIGNAYNLPIEENCIDAAFAIGVWFHLEDLDTAAKEIYRVLKPNAEFAIFTANPNLNHVWESFFAKQGEYRKSGKVLEGAVGTGNWKLSHNIFYLHSFSEIENSIASNNFKIISVEKFGYKDEHNDEGVWMSIRGIKT